MPAFTTSLVQFNPKVGDINGNIEAIRHAFETAKDEGADLVITSELSVCGYPPEDLVLLPSFQNQTMEAVETLADLTANGPALIVGAIYNDSSSGHLYNCAFFLADGEIHSRYDKINLPNYGVFDEVRVFNPGQNTLVIEYKSLIFGLLICEDIWKTNLALELKEKGAELIIALNASPFEKNKQHTQHQVIQDATKATSLPIIYTNQVGGQDELVFAGGSFIMDQNSQITHIQPKWEEHILTCGWQKNNDGWTPREPNAHLPLPEEKYDDIYEALITGLSDYVEKNYFPGVIIGMSGGVDSALTAAIACDALGPERVKLVMLPSLYTSNESLADAQECAKLLNAHIDSISIAPMVDQAQISLESQFKECDADITEENIQSRIRAVILMALSNKFNYMVLTTGNKSEMAVGYATLYGDMCGGFNVLKDIYKTEVYELCQWRNNQEYVIPQTILDKAPTAELKPDQTDQDTLPDYVALDTLLYHLLEQRMSSEQITATLGFDPELTTHIARLVKISEYKRRQAPPGVKISQLAFGRDRRFPLTNGFKL